MTKLFVGGIPADLEDVELEEIFRDFGTVISVNIVRDKRTKASRRFGFVDMASSEDARRAIDLLHTGSIDGQEISVKLAIPNLKESTSKAGKIPGHVRKVVLKQAPPASAKKKRPRISKNNI